MFIRPLQVRLGFGALFQEKHLVWRKLPPGEAQPQPAWPCPAAVGVGGPCVGGGDEVTHPLPGASHTFLVPCDVVFTCVSQGIGAGFFPFLLFSPLCVWPRGPAAAALTAGEKPESGFVGRPTLELPASLGLPSSARDTANC